MTGEEKNVQMRGGREKGEREKGVSTLTSAEF